MLKRTVLVVDDQEINRKILKKLLCGKYKVIEAANGAEAMNCLNTRAENISAIFLDIVMPEMDGYEVLRQMRENTLLSKIPVIVSSQQEGNDTELQALSLGAIDFISKPYNGNIVLRRLENMIRLRETAAIINKVERDELTGAYNKAFFIEKVENQFAQHPKEQYDMLCLGVERFKVVNEIYGEEKADKLLKYIAELLMEESMHVILCGRCVPDAFWLLLPRRKRYSASLLKPILEKIDAFPLDLDIEIYCGVYQIEESDKTVASMCDKAQMAADANKGNYTERFTYYNESMHRKILDEQLIISSMQSALDQNCFEVYYQPKYELRTEMVAGAEALVRWNHPERGWLSPASFIPIFEKNGFIIHLDRYVWEHVCQDIRKWIDMGYAHVSISVNVSRADLYNPKLTETLLGLIEKYNIPIHSLHLEITESAYTDNPEQLIETVKKLRNLGFVLEMDDFGSGYSSLNMLSEMPVDVLKLDMRFIQSESNSPSARGILSFVISLAKWLNLPVVAEGVETKEQISMLQAMDCNYVQGFFYARPMPREDFEKLLRTERITDMACMSRTMSEFEFEPIPGQNPSLLRTMLVVDDIEVSRAVLAAVFIDRFTIIEKSSADAAWNYLSDARNHTDIVMLGLHTEEGENCDLLEKIRMDARLHSLPVIISARHVDALEKRAKVLRADDYISKPYNTEIIRQRVDSVVAAYEATMIKQSQNQAGGNTEKKKGKKSIVEQLEQYFDIVRIVDPERTVVVDQGEVPCSEHDCFSVWNRTSRCNNCVSLKAMRSKGRCSKLERTPDGLFMVISAYMQGKNGGKVLELVTKVDDALADTEAGQRHLNQLLDGQGVEGQGQTPADAPNAAE